MAEWLRREIRNLMGSARVGSNPAAVVFFSFYFSVCIVSLCMLNQICPCGLTAKALVSGAKDCGFESRQGYVCANEQIN